MAITVNRGGETSNFWYEEGIKAQLTKGKFELNIRFKLASKGGGTTDVAVNIPMEEWENIIDQMLRSGGLFAVQQVGKALANYRTGLRTMCPSDEELRREARKNELREEANKDAPPE